MKQVANICIRYQMHEHLLHLLSVDIIWPPFHAAAAAAAAATSIQQQLVISPF